MRDDQISMLVSGQLACFTRPEAKTERFTYPFITRTAAKGILDSIFFLPQFQWNVESVEILNPIKYVSFSRNEVRLKKGFPRGPRQTTCLKDVAYIIRATPELQHHLIDAEFVPNEGKIHIRSESDCITEFNERVFNGRYSTKPHLGCREFVADVGLSPEEYSRAPITMNSVMMLSGFEYTDDYSSEAWAPQFMSLDVIDGLVDFTKAERAANVS